MPKRDITQQFPHLFRRVPRGGHHELQSPVPSQDQPVGVPFNPALQPDMKAPVRTTNRPFMQQSDSGDTGPQLPTELADVRHVFDSRPVSGYDFWFEDRFQGLGNNNAPGGVFGPTLGGYRVPDGYNLFLRRINVSLWVNPFNTTGTNKAWAPNALFQLEYAPKMSILVDGAATPFWSSVNQIPNGVGLPGIPLMFPTMQDYEIPCFIPIASGSLMTANFVIEGAGATNDMDNFVVFVQYYGNLIADTGRSLANEAGNGDPLPVVVEGE